MEIRRLNRRIERLEDRLATARPPPPPLFEEVDAERYEERKLNEEIRRSKARLRKLLAARA